MLYKRQEFTKELFQNPTNEYRGAPFWSWNCKLTKEEADAILADLKMMGMETLLRQIIDTPILT